MSRETGKQLKFELPLEVSLDNVDSLFVPSTEFIPCQQLQAWVEERKGRRLRMVVAGLIKSGEVRDCSEIPDYLDHLCHRMDEDEVRTQVTDYSGRSKLSPRYYMLGQLLSLKPAKGQGHLYHRLGYQSHLAITSLYCGGFKVFRPDHQLALFPDRLFDDVFYPGFKYQQEVSASGHPSDKLLGKLGELLAILQPAFDNGAWSDHFRDRVVLADYQDIMGALFGPLSFSLSKEGDLTTNYLVLKTLLSWGVGVLEYCIYPPPGICFREVVTRNGRIDLLEVVRVNGNTPKESDRLALTSLARGKNGHNGNLLASYISDKFRDVKIRIREFKFGIGDGMAAEKEIKEDDVRDKPRQRDIEQVRRYLVAMSSFVPEAEIHYLLGTVNHPIVYKMDNIEVGDVRQQVHDRAKKRAMARHIDNIILERVIDKLTKKGAVAMGIRDTSNERLEFACFLRI